MRAPANGVQSAVASAQPTLIPRSCCQAEERRLRAEQRAARGQADTPTTDMYQDCMELLTVGGGGGWMGSVPAFELGRRRGIAWCARTIQERCMAGMQGGQPCVLLLLPLSTAPPPPPACLPQMFGVPYVIAPQEAEAQCAWLDANGLVDGVVTDDNDAFLFGARRVYRWAGLDAALAAAWRAAGPAWHAAWMSQLCITSSAAGTFLRTRSMRRSTGPMTWRQVARKRALLGAAVVQLWCSTLWASGHKTAGGGIMAEPQGVAPALACCVTVWFRCYLPPGHDWSGPAQADGPGAAAGRRLLRGRGGCGVQATA